MGHLLAVMKRLLTGSDRLLVMALLLSPDRDAHRRGLRRGPIRRGYERGGGLPWRGHASSRPGVWYCGGLAVGVLGGAVSQLPRFERAPGVAARA